MDLSPFLTQTVTSALSRNDPLQLFWIDPYEKRALPKGKRSTSDIIHAAGVWG